MCRPALQTSSMRSCDEPGKTSVERGDRRLPMGAIRSRPPQTNGSAGSNLGLIHAMISAML